MFFIDTFVAISFANSHMDPASFARRFPTRQRTTEIKYSSQTFTWHSVTEAGPRLLPEPDREMRQHRFECVHDSLVMCAWPELDTKAAHRAPRLSSPSTERVQEAVVRLSCQVLIARAAPCRTPKPQISVTRPKRQRRSQLAAWKSACTQSGFQLHVEPLSASKRVTQQPPNV